MEKDVVGKKRFSDLLRDFLNSSGPLLALLVICLILTFVSDSFLTMKNIMNVCRQSSINGFVALGVMFTILTAGIDLSVGSSLAFSGAVMAIAVVKMGLNPYAGILLCLLTGTAIGFANGIMLTKLRLPHPFISTMGTMNIFRGLTLIIMLATPISDMPPVVKFVGASFLGPVPVSFLLLLLVYLVIHFFLNNTTTGRHIYAVGGNKDAARLSGVNVDWILTVVYAMSGLMAAVGALILAGRVNAVYPLAGMGYEMDAIAACIIGGTSFFGGKGTVWGTFVGALMMGVIRNGLNLLNVSPSLQTVAIGLIIIIAVYIDVLRQERMMKVKGKYR